MEKFGTSLPDVQSREMQNLEETMRACNKNSTPQLAAYVTKMQQMSIYLAVNVTFKFITDGRYDVKSYQLYYFVERKSKYTCVNRQQAL